MPSASVSLSDALRACRAGAAALVPETAAGIVVLTAEQIAARPCILSLDAILLSVDGSVRPLAGPQGDDTAAAVALREILAALLQTSRGTSPAIHAAAPARRADSLNGLTRELEAALVPFNRSAAKRALARLARETLAVKPTGTAEAQAPVEAPNLLQPTLMSEPGMLPSLRLEVEDADDGDDEAASIEVSFSPDPANVSMSPTSSTMHGLWGLAPVAPKPVPPYALSEVELMAIDDGWDDVQETSQEEPTPTDIASPWFLATSVLPTPAPDVPGTAPLNQHRVDELIERYGERVIDELGIANLRDTRQGLRSLAALDLTPTPGITAWTQAVTAPKR